MKIVQHPDRFRDGTRVLMLKGRHKDGIEHERAIVRVTHSADHHARTMDELAAIARDGERIYRHCVANAP